MKIMYGFLATDESGKEMMFKSNHKNEVEEMSKIISNDFDKINYYEIVEGIEDLFQTTNGITDGSRNN